MHLSPIKETLHWSSRISWTFRLYRGFVVRRAGDWVKRILIAVAVVGRVFFASPVSFCLYNFSNLTHNRTHPFSLCVFHRCIRSTERVIIWIFVVEMAAVYAWRWRRRWWRSPPPPSLRRRRVLSRTWRSPIGATDAAATFVGDCTQSGFWS